MLFLNIFVCIICKKDSETKICNKCFQQLKFRNGCIFCGIICSCNIKTYVPFSYNDTIAKFILQLKYNFSFHLIDFFLDFIPLGELFNKYFIPIPISHKRLWERGYNQTMLISEKLASLCNGHVLSCLKKNKYTIQKNASSIERFLNAQSILLKEELVWNNMNICIVDDTISSGATILRAIDLLRPFAHSISILAIAKT